LTGTSRASIRGIGSIVRLYSQLILMGNGRLNIYLGFKRLLIAMMLGVIIRGLLGSETFFREDIYPRGSH
jgi:hypothetical protein